MGDETTYEHFHIQMYVVFFLQLEYEVEFKLFIDRPKQGRHRQSNNGQLDIFS